MSISAMVTNYVEGSKLQKNALFLHIHSKRFCLHFHLDFELTTVNLKK